MAEDFKWVNVDRKEYLEPLHFNLGSRSTNSVGRGNELLSSLRELLYKEWNGCRIVFLGDECDPMAETSTDIFRIMLKQAEEIGYPGNIFDVIYEGYKNVSCLFKVTEEEVKASINGYFSDIRDGFNPCNEYGIDPADPYKGMFQREGRDYRYTLNSTKRIAYSLDETQILFRDGEEADFVDPLPILMGYGEIFGPGDWLGDIIGVSDELPEGYILLDKVYVDG